ncbi:glycosyltransferase [Allokutzneria albata]|uniref:Methyltransferase domain-containing protein n=1 Tax=Allokutzneria albata TaxID=211114 RepID=A0A1H0A2W5_ALLAB|nr:glycosyltransferase [Allokutzneria albata]SDN27561.1 Methyltransferase domain-containing protein [Allokutzneria albata]
MAERDDEVRYADGAEDSVLSALRAARDVSSGSDELAAQAVGWELNYHFSPQRQGLLAPLRLREGLRAADLGCGSGVLARGLAEAGAHVLGVEGVPSRAEAARVRCRDLATVEIVTGRVEQGLAGRDPFDLVLLCGLLEHTAGDPDGPANTLRSAVGALAEDGVLVLAIENQLGLGYLAGRHEDHHSTPWVGLADYPVGRRSPRTWGAKTLAAMLAEHGLSAQRWLVPYPDYKLPKVVLDGRIFNRLDAPVLIDKLVRDPLQGAFGGNDAVVSGRALQRVLVGEGLGLSTAPCFLIVAARSADAIRAHTQDQIGWMVNNSRRAAYRRSRVLSPQFQLETLGGAREAADGWLRHQVLAQEPLLPGRPLDAYLLDALHNGDQQELERLLRLWREVCRAGARPPAEDDLLHPFLPGRPGVPVLPPDHLDIHPGNILVLPDGATVRVDREWLAGSGVDAELAELRALLEFCREVVTSRAAHPWQDAITLRGLLLQLCEPIGLRAAAESRWDELVEAESVFQELVTGKAAATTADAIRSEAEALVLPPLWDAVGGLTALRERAAGLETQIGEHLAAIEAERGEFEQLLHTTRVEAQRAEEALAVRTEEAEQLRHNLEVAKAEVAKLDRRMGMAMRELAASAQQETRARAEAQQARQAEAALRAELDGMAARLNQTRARLDRLEASKLVKLGHRRFWPTARALRGARDLVLGRAGEEPDAVLRKVAKHAPGLAAVVGAVARHRSGAAREGALRFHVELPDEPVHVGLGQVVEFTGWVFHADLPLRAAWMVSQGREHPVSLGYPRPDVVAALSPLGLRVPDGSGMRVRVPVRAVPAEQRVDLALRVELVDGTVLERQLPEFTVLPGTGAKPLDVSWPGSGPKVAICMATYSPSREYLEQQLDSIRAQTHRNWVCVLCDDASPEPARKLIRELVGGDTRFVFVENEDNVGFYRNFERALRLVPADADAVALSDQDDVWDPDKIETLLAELADPQVQLAYSDMRLVDHDGRHLADSFWQRRRNQCEDLLALAQLNTVTGGACLARGDFVREQVLPFPPGTISVFHDHWMAVMALGTGRIAFVDRPLYSYRQHGDAITGHREDDLDEGLPPLSKLAMAAVGLGDPLTDEQRARLDAVAEYELTRLAQFATVLLLRDSGRITGEVRERLLELAMADRRVKPLYELTRLPESTRAVTAGAENLFLAAALRHRAEVARRLDLPPRPEPPLD